MWSHEGRALVRDPNVDHTGPRDVPQDVHAANTGRGVRPRGIHRPGEHRLRGAGRGGNLRPVAPLPLLRRHHQDLWLHRELHEEELRHLTLWNPQQLLVGPDLEHGLALLRLLLPCFEGLRLHLLEVLLRWELHHQLQAVCLPVPMLLTRSIEVPRGEPGE
jgi:hypothetical protein